MLEKMVEGVVERRMLELFGNRNFVEKYEAQVAKAKEAKAHLGARLWDNDKAWRRGLQSSPTVASLKS